MLQQDIINIVDLELHIKEKMNELKWKSKLLDESQQELLQIRQELLKKEINLEEQTRTINDLKMQLESAHQIIEVAEKEKIKCTNERIQLQINCDVALKERDSLLKQTHAAKLENMTLKLSVQQLAEKAATTETARKGLEESLLEMRDRFLQVHITFQSYVTKLEKEHQLILKSIETVTKLNKRLQTVGLCTHAIYTKKNEEIKGLQKELAMKTEANVPPQINQELSHYNKPKRFDAKAYIEQIRLDLDNHIAADKEVEAFLTEFESD